MSDPTDAGWGMIEIGILQFTLRLRGCRSLKGKRRIVKSIKERLKHRYNVSVAEIDDLDVWQKGTIGLTMCSNDSGHIVSEFSKIVDQLRVHPEAELVDHEIQIL